jgi:ankyrin repeat protein
MPVKYRQQVLEILLNSGANPGTRNSAGDTPLSLACRSPALHPLVSRLLTAHAEVNARQNSTGCTALMVACEYGSLETVRILLDSDADVTIMDHDHQTALHHLCKGAAKDESSLTERIWQPILNRLLSARIDLDALDKSHKTALFYCTGSELAPLLLEAGCNPSLLSKLDQLRFCIQFLKKKSGSAALLMMKAAPWLCSGRWDKTLEQVLQGHVEGNLLQELFGDLGGGLGILPAAVQSGDARVVSLMLDAHADVNSRATTANSETPLVLACGDPDMSVIRCLLERGADPNAQCQLTGQTSTRVTPLLRSCHSGNIEVVKLLLEHKARADDRCSMEHATSLGLMARMGSQEMVALLLASNANPNFTEGYTIHSPLYLAAEAGHDKVVAQLLTARADVMFKNHEGEHPLSIAAKTGNFPRVAQLLLENKAQVNSPNMEGLTPLQSAAVHGHVGMTKVLIKGGAEVSQMAAPEFSQSLVTLCVDNPTGELLIAVIISRIQRHIFFSSFSQRNRF